MANHHISGLLFLRIIQQFQVSISWIFSRFSMPWAGRPRFQSKNIRGGSVIRRRSSGHWGNAYLWHAAVHPLWVLAQRSSAPAVSTLRTFPTLQSRRCEYTAYMLNAPVRCEYTAYLPHAAVHPLWVNCVLFPRCSAPAVSTLHTCSTLQCAVSTLHTCSTLQCTALSKLRTFPTLQSSRCEYTAYLPHAAAHALWATLPHRDAVYSKLVYEWPTFFPGVNPAFLQEGAPTPIQGYQPYVVHCFNFLINSNKLNEIVSAWGCTPLNLTPVSNILQSSVTFEMISIVELEHLWKNIRPCSPTSRKKNWEVTKCRLNNRPRNSQHFKWRYTWSCLQRVKGCKRNYSLQVGARC